jgi:hypothetical protein
MAFDEGVAERIRTLLADQGEVQERKMFGGLKQPHVCEMDFTGRSMKGMVYIAVDGFAEDVDLARWVEQGTSYARSLEPK